MAKNSKKSINADKMPKTVIVLLLIIPLVFYGTLLSSFFFLLNNIHDKPREVHLPTSVKTYDFIFEDNNENYYLRDSIGHTFGKKLNNEYVNWNKVLSLDNVCSFLSCHIGASDDQYLYLYVDNHYGRINSDFEGYFLAYDKDLNLIHLMNVSDKYYYVLDMIAYNDYIYAYTINYDNENCELHRISFLNNEDEVLLSNIKKVDVYNDDNISIIFKKYDYYFHGEMRVVLDQTKMFYDSNSISLLNTNLSFSSGCITIVNKDKKFIYDIDIDNPKFYENAYITNNKIKFSIYDYINNEQCGGNGQNCICNYGKSYYYEFDLITNSIIEEKEYNFGTFIIDCSLDHPIYYYDKGLYFGNTFIRSCEEIVYSETIIWNNGYEKTKYFKNFEIFYMDGMIYGV